MVYLKNSCCGNRCDVTVEYSVQLNEALSGNPNFDGKSRENIY